eukprot:Amastigsp_a342383_21.p1 type:complete len:231 gc:universal Amastigsp_a342383_21:772-80(-)
MDTSSGGRCVCVADFEPMMGDELGARALDVVTVKETFSDGWVLALNERTQALGVVPRALLAALPSGVAAPRPTRAAPSFDGDSTIAAKRQALADAEDAGFARGSGRAVSSEQASRSRSGTVGAVAMSGYLELQLVDEKWRKSWYSVEGSALKVCKNPSSLAKRVDELRFDLSSSVRLLRHQTDATAPPVIEIVTSKKTIYLRTSSPKDAELWLSAIQSAIASAPGGGVFR